jgi:hypothetical protein
MIAAKLNYIIYVISVEIKYRKINTTKNRKNKKPSSSTKRVVNIIGCKKIYSIKKENK